MRNAIAVHPDRGRIDLRQHRIDTRDEAFRLAASPWDWGWTYLNGEEISLFQYGGDELRDEIARRAASLPCFPATGRPGRRLDRIPNDGAGS